MLDIPDCEVLAGLQGFVRPRFTDAGLEAALLLEEQYVETFLEADAPRRQLVLTGPRGSGLTTALSHLARLTGDRGDRSVVQLGELLGEGAGAALARLDRGEGVLLVDLSVTPVLPAGRWRALRQLLDPGAASPALEVLRRSRLVVAGPEPVLGAEWLRRWLQPVLPVDEARLAPWSHDELLELLGSSPRYRRQRGRLFGALAAVPEVAPALARPRTARWLVEAAARLGPEQRVSLAALYANVLDELSPWALEVLRTLARDELSAPDVQRLLAEPPPDPREAARLFEVDHLLGYLLECRSAEGTSPPSAELRRTVRGLTEIVRSALVRSSAVRQEGREEEPDDATQPAWRRELQAALEQTRIRLALPGLQHFLQAGHCLHGVTAGQVPPDVPASWFPYLRELITERAREVLRGWLRAGEPLGPRADGAAATILWATGEVPPLSCERRRLDLSGARLAGLPLPGAELQGARLRFADLDQAKLQGSDLREAELTGAHASGALLDGADLSGAMLAGVRLRRAVLRGATARGARLWGADLERAQLAGARLEGAELKGGKADGADLSRADLTRARLHTISLTDVTLTGARLREAELQDLDLCSVGLRGVDLERARLIECQLEGVELDELALTGVNVEGCDLTEATFHQAALVGAVFHGCRAHGALFDGADLRGARFIRVDFQAGSSRCGLLLGQPPLEGSRTGFYAEGTSDDAWLSPEALRQASFRGANLIGVEFVDTDLFRVDLRGAIMDEVLRAQARQAGAILD